MNESCENCQASVDDGGRIYCYRFHKEVGNADVCKEYDKEGDNER